MTGFEQFLQTFGGFTIEKLIILVLAIVFCVMIYKKIKNYFVDRYKVEEKRDEQLKTALDEVNKYPQYRAQSIKMQEYFQKEIDELKFSVEEIKEAVRILQEDEHKRDKNKLRDRLLQSYRYYMNREQNPKREWTKMEAEAFWELFKDYESLGGNGYIHTVVQPAMNLLTVVDNE